MSEWNIVTYSVWVIDCLVICNGLEILLIESFISVYDTYVGNYLHHDLNITPMPTPIYGHMQKQNIRARQIKRHCLSLRSIEWHQLQPKQIRKSRWFKVLRYRLIVNISNRRARSYSPWRKPRRTTVSWTLKCFSFLTTSVYTENIADCIKHGVARRHFNEEGEKAKMDRSGRSKRFNQTLQVYVAKHLKGLKGD